MNPTTAAIRTPYGTLATCDFVTRSAAWIFLACVVAFLSGCSPGSSKRVYEETVSAPADDARETADDPQALLEELRRRGEDPHEFMRNIPPDETSAMSAVVDQELPVSWNVPSSWIEKSGSGMRLVSFTTKESSSIDVSIVALGGVAGGTFANVNRWMNQIHLPPMEEEKFQQFLAQQERLTTADNAEIVVVDLTALQERGDETRSGILAAILEGPEQTLFIKMAGTGKDIEKNRAPFKELCRSLYSTGL